MPASHSVTEKLGNTVRSVKSILSILPARYYSNYVMLLEQLLI